MAAIFDISLFNVILVQNFSVPCFLFSFHGMYSFLNLWRKKKQGELGGTVCIYLYGFRLLVQVVHDGNLAQLKLNSRMQY